MALQKPVGGGGGATTKPKPKTTTTKKNCQCGTTSSGNCKPCQDKKDTPKTSGSYKPGTSTTAKPTTTTPATTTSKTTVTTKPSTTASSATKVTADTAERKSKKKKSSGTARTGSADTMERKAMLDLLKKEEPVTTKKEEPVTTTVEKKPDYVFGSADRMEGQIIAATAQPGDIVGGPDRRLPNGGGVVDGVYIPPGIDFGALGGGQPVESPSLPLIPAVGNAPAATPIAATTPDLTPASGLPVTGTGLPADTGGTAAPGATGSNVEQTAKLYADALAALQQQYQTSQGNILDAITRMERDPYNKANAYAQMQVLSPTVAANPLAEYMAAAGMSGGQAAAAQNLAQAQADAYTRAMQNVQNIMSTSQQQANASRMADIGLVRTGATQDLESNLNMLRLGLEKERLGAVTGLQQRNLENEMAIRNALTSSISNIFAGQNVSPESILKLIESALAKLNMRNWTTLPLPGA